MESDVKAKRLSRLLEEITQEKIIRFWRNANELHWFQKVDKVIDDSDKPFTNGSQVQKQILFTMFGCSCKTFRRNKLALIWEGENGESKTYSYFALHRETCKFANVLKSMGVQKGDRVTIYMGRTPEIVIAMLACARIGAVHSVVYGGFSVESLAERIEDSNSRVLIVSDGAYQRGKIVHLKQIADEALQRCGTVEHCLVVKRTGEEVNMEQGRDMWYHELMNLPIATQNCALEIMDSEDPLFILYTSGQQENQRLFCILTAAIWLALTQHSNMFLIYMKKIVIGAPQIPAGLGHSYIVYGPLLNGNTSFMYEAPNFPYPNRWWL